ncbi:E3 ubiquitin ligase BIG BROTHER-related isoform X1 [Brassica rapa]|uniref:E3 ubiquitin ligase BIG BROTHER-related isoform X1 n=1 Tax=Brassica campestris TaxID=3711 RepID=UPI0004F1927F|nr:E3 ubiquitin ligase BIG BROTHER-related isoform X1 [Brassica rapa]
MPRLVNQSSVDENIAMFLQFGLSEDSDLTVNHDVIAREIQQQYQNNSTVDDAAIAYEIQHQEEDSDLTVNDDVIAREIQQQYPNNSDLTANDDVIAREIQQQYQNNLTYDDTAIALEIQKQEGNLPTSLSDDEKLARYLQQQDESANSTDEDIQGNNSYIPERDAPSTSRTIIQYDDDDHFSGHHTHTRTQSNSPSISSLDLSTNENTDPANMTYEELNELEDSMGNVDRGLSQRRISKLPTYKYGAETKTCCWQIRKKKFIATDTQCSICLVDYVMGDKITTLPCKHIYHKDCISQWLKQSKVCCVCKAEV